MKNLRNNSTYAWRGETIQEVVRCSEIIPALILNRPVSVYTLGLEQKLYRLHWKRRADLKSSIVGAVPRASAPPQVSGAPACWEATGFSGGLKHLQQTSTNHRISMVP